MAAATITSLRCGFYLTGGTDATTVTTGPIRIKAFLFVPDDDDDTLTVTDYAGNAVFITVGPNADQVNVIEMFGACFDGLKITLNDDGNTVLILVE